MSGWRYFAERLNGNGTSTLLHPDLPLSDVSIDLALSGPGGLSATIEPEMLSLQALDGRPVFREWSTVIWAEHDDVIRGGGILERPQISDSRLSLECVGYSGYARDLPFTSSKFFVEADPADIFRYIWTHIQAQPNGNLGITVDPLTTTARIGVELKQVEFDTQEGPVSFESGPYKLEWWQTHNLQSNLDELASYKPLGASSEAFEYREDPRWHADTVSMHIALKPQFGKRQHDLRFAIGENVHTIPDVEFAGDEFANSVLMLGAGEGRTMVRAETSRQDGRLRRVAVVQDKQIRSKALALKEANRELALRRSEFTITDLVVHDHPHAPLGAWDVGDEILVEGDLGWVDNEGGVWVRVVGLSIRPDAPETMTATVLRSDKAQP